MFDDVGVVMFVILLYVEVLFGWCICFEVDGVLVFWYVIIMWMENVMLDFYCVEFWMGLLNVIYYGEGLYLFVFGGI